MFPVMQCGRDPAGTFAIMLEASTMFNLTSNSEGMENTSSVNSGHSVKMRLSFSPETETNVSKLDQLNVTCEIPTLLSISDDSSSCQSSTETNDELSTRALSTCVTTKNVSPGDKSAKQQHVNKSEDKENTATATTPDNSQERETSSPRSQQDCNMTSHTMVSNSEVVRRAQEDGRVNVVFSGTVTQDGCCCFVRELLKCILYQRQQLPMTYDELVYSQKKQQASMQDKDTVCRRPVQSADMDWRKRQQTLEELEEVLQQLEVLFSLSRVPRVLLLMGGSLVLPKELYEINMEALVLAGGDESLRVSSCLRQLFRTLFVADLLSDTGPVRLTPTTVLVLAHRNCGVGWFRPKLQFKVPTRVKKQIIALSSDPSASNEPRAECIDWQDYVWFQAPITIKGFKN
ncbi:hypothetical protein Q8A73_001527 [Channa argus]|nr:hypothetical protein Q8A73_001527 [Channa argus]